MGLFHLQKPKIKELPVDFAFTKALHSTLYKKRLLRHRVSDKVAAKHFRLLRESGSSQDQIAEVLDWFLNHIGEPYLPVVYSTKGFREKFPNLLEAMQRNQIPTTKEGEEIVKKLQELHWPKGSYFLLPDAIHRSLKSYKKFYLQFMETKERIEKELKKGVIQDGLRKSKMCRAMNALIECGVIQEPKKFILNHFRDFRDRYINFPDWQGSLDKAIIDINSTAFQGKMMDFFDRWCGNPQFWLELKETIQ